MDDEHRGQRNYGFIVSKNANDLREHEVQKHSAEGFNRLELVPITIVFKRNLVNPQAVYSQGPTRGKKQKCVLIKDM